MLAALLPFLASAVFPFDRRIVYVGRFDRTDPGAPACQWSASEVRMRVKGPTLIAQIEEKGEDRWQVVVDGVPLEVLTLRPGLDSYTVDLSHVGAREAITGVTSVRVAPEVHDVLLVKRTEAFVGTTRFRGFDAPGGSFSRAHAARRRIEVIGDSITCGFGNEAANQQEKFTAATENAYMSYASIAARTVDADVTLLAWSGRKMWPNATMPAIYDLILPTREDSKYDFSGSAPQAVVINLATNDFGAGNPDETQWTAAYEAFIRRIWTHYPRAQVFATFGGMMSDAYPAGQQALSAVRGYITRMVARMHDPRVHIVEFDVQNAADGFGADWHPSLKTDAKMGARLAEALRKEMNW
jgi:GDSL-like lipase/acylhydrolase family protein/carbohydrate esterase-like protein